MVGYADISCRIEAGIAGITFERPGKLSAYPDQTANKRLNTAYLLRESFAQLWDYKSQAWARRFFDNWKSQLRWQRLKPFEGFAQMIERHWDAVAAYCRPESRIALSFVEGLNNEIRVFQRRANGLRDEDCLRLKILTCSMPDICINQNPPTQKGEER